MRIHVELPRNRAEVGKLTLSAEVPFTCDCRGKADNARARRADNAGRDPTKPYGDTPSGQYEPTTLVTFDDPHARLGWGWIPLEGKSGDALKAKAYGKRTGLGIHAGRGEVLMATYGCLRLKQSDFDTLAELVGSAELEVTIVDIDGTPGD